MEIEIKEELSLDQFIKWVLENKMFGEEFKSKHGKTVYITLDGSLSIIGDTSKERLLGLNDTFIVELINGTEHDKLMECKAKAFDEIRKVFEDTDLYTDEDVIQVIQEQLYKMEQEDERND